jgi:hypothetical protein
MWPRNLEAALARREPVQIHSIDKSNCLELVVASIIPLFEGYNLRKIGITCQPLFIVQHFQRGVGLVPTGSRFDPMTAKVKDAPQSNY